MSDQVKDKNDSTVSKVTVVMPAYQAARTIVRAIDSIRTQTFRDWQLIVVDDGSTDSTGELAQHCAAKDSRITVFTNEKNVGAATSMNRAWRATDSPLVAIMDADDAAMPARLEREAAFLDRHPSVDVLGSAAHFLDATGQFWRTVILPSSHSALSQQRWYACPFIHPTVMMRRGFLEAMNGYTDGLRLGEDYDLWMRGFFSGAFCYENLPEPLVFYTAKRVQHWKMIRASARVRLQAGRREQRLWRSRIAAARILAEGALEQTRIFSLRDRLLGPKGLPQLTRPTP